MSNTITQPPAASPIKPLPPQLTATDRKLTPVQGLAAKTLPMATRTRTPPRRNFNPKKTARYGYPTLTPDILVRYSPKWGYSRLFNFPFSDSQFRPRMHTMVLSIDGSCRVNDQSKDMNRAACAVFSGPGCKDNYATILSGNQATSNRAELHAAIMALDIVGRKMVDGQLELVREVILKTDSKYVARAMGWLVWGWERNGWRTRKGDVDNRDLVERLHGMVKGFEGTGVAVRFWRVERAWNEEADGMANAVLDGRK